VSTALRKAAKARRQLQAEEPVVDINTTPLIDVMLVLLVMLIITIPIQLHDVKLDLPIGSPPPAAQTPEVLRLELDAQSTVLWNGSPVADLEELRRRLAEAAAQPQPPEVHLRPNAHARYERFAELVVAINQAGLSKLGVVGAEQFLEDQ